jgi:hypothetical protein
VKVPLLGEAGSIRPLALAEAPVWVKPNSPPTSRRAYAAVHVVPLRWADNVPGAPAVIDWDETLAFRHHIWSWGLGVAEAMDTAQRNMGLDHEATRELITRTAAAARAVGGRVVAGVNTDHLTTVDPTLRQIVDAYVSQLHFCEDHGVRAVLMASRHLARAATSPADYEHVYHEVLSRAGSPVIIHWLGTAFDPALVHYFGATCWQSAADTLIRIVEASTDAVAGIKMSLLDAEAEIAVRSRLPRSVTMYTGDDYNYVRLIEGAQGLYSDALLGAFAAVAPAAGVALQALDRGDHEEYRRILSPTEALSRQIFAAPTSYYKTGIAFLSWLNGHQSAFSMVGGLHSGRGLRHLSEVVRLADAAGALERPDLAAERWTAMLALNGLRP